MSTLKGYCPMGCGQTLFVGAGGHITCSRIDCPNPTAVDQILGDPETEHVADFGDHGFSILHPLRERLDDDQGGLFGCALHQAIEALSGPPVKPGRYRARPVGAGPAVTTWTYEEVPG